MLLQSCAPDLLPTDTPEGVWNSCRNVYFRDGQTIRVPGDLPVTALGTLKPYVMVYTEVSGEGFWLLANLTTIIAHNGITQFNITPTGWAPGPGAVFTADVINGLAVINSSDQHPVYWDGVTANKMKPLPNWPAGRFCTAMRAHKNFLFAIGMTDNGGNECLWSDAAGPGEIPPTWIAAADNLAGSVNLAPMFELCLDAVGMRDDLLIYKRSSIWSCTFVGGNAVFAFRLLFAEAGLAATNAVCRSTDDRHLFVAAVGDVFITDGVRCQSVLEGSAQRTFQTTYNGATTPLIFASSVQRLKVGVVFYPEVGSPNVVTGLIYDFTSGAISFRDVPNPRCAAEGALLGGDIAENLWDNDPNPWDSDTTSWNTQIEDKTINDVMIGGAKGIFCVSQPFPGPFEDGPVKAMATKTGVRLKGGKRSTMTAIWPQMEGNAGDTVFIRMLAQEVLDGPFAPSVAQPYVIGQKEPVSDFVSGRYIGIEVTSQAAGIWRLGSFEIDFAGNGKW